MSYRHFAVRCILVQGLNIGAAPFIRSLRFGSSFKNIFFVQYLCLAGNLDTMAAPVSEGTSGNIREREGEIFSLLLYTQLKLFLGGLAEEND